MTVFAVSMMKVILIALLCSLAASVPLDRLAPLHGTDSLDVVPNEYIVVFDSENVGDNEVSAHMKMVSGLIEKEENELFRVGRSYNIGNRFRGYHAVVPPNVLDIVRAQGEVKYVEQNQVVRLAQTDCVDQKSPKSWGLVRTAFRAKYVDDSDYSYAEDVLGEGVDAYIIDTGIDTTHPDFSGRAIWGIDYIDDEYDDLNGHGTHVTGTVIGDQYGLAKKATAIAVRVLNANGSGTFEGVISGINWTATEYNNRGRRAVANMSLGGGLYEAVHDALEAAVKEGVFFAVAAGNDYGNACTKTPAASEFAMTVGATDIEDGFAYFSNYGNCVEILAPGVSIPSAYPGGGESYLSGTSMASPHVAGLAAKYLGTLDGESKTPQEVEDYLIEISTKDAVTGIPDTDTPNRLAFMDCA